MVLEVKNICKSFGKREILKNVSFSVDKGEIVGFIGPNGAGKTTAIKVILGLLKADGGSVAIEGHDIVKEHDKALASVGAIIESPELYPYMTGKQNLMQFARISGIDEKRVDEVAEIVGLGNRINDKVGRYSLGMRQRLGVAQAILHDPRLLILDEPTNGLDPSGIKDLRDMLKNLAASGVAVLVSSHLLSELEQFCTSAVIIEQGVIIDTKSLAAADESGVSDLPLFVFDVSDNAAAERALSAYKCERAGDKLGVRIYRDDVPNAVKALVAADVSVYGVEFRKKTLEESYLEATTQTI